jgi:chromosome segregation ATPase
MTTRREVPFTGDTLAWVHSELADIKSRLALAQQAAEQSRAVASDAADKAYQTRVQMDQFDGQAAAIEHLQDDLRALREQIVRAQDDIHSLRQSREELERRSLADAERIRQERNEVGRHFGEVQRQMEGWQERFVAVEETNRRNMEAASQLLQRIEALESQQSDDDTLRSRMFSAVSRIDQEIQRFTAMLAALEREDEVHHERVNSVFESLRRLETDLESMRSETNQISRISDRLELVQAERTRHNERLNELSQDMSRVDATLGEHTEHGTLLEARIAGYQDELRSLKERMGNDRERITQYLYGLNDLLADLRKRQVAALEKEMRDLRSRAINFAEE